MGKAVRRVTAASHNIKSKLANSVGLGSVYNKAHDTFMNISPSAAVFGEKNNLWRNLASGNKGPELKTADSKLWNVSEEIKPAQEEYAKLLARSSAAGAATGARADVLQQMGQAALGKGPSLAEAQMKAASDRNLSQQLAALQAQPQGGSALGQRALMQSMGSAGRDLAQQAGISRLQERNDFMNQSAATEAALARDITGKLNLDLMPKQEKRTFELARIAAENAKAEADAERKRQMTGAITGGIGAVVGGIYGGGQGAAAGQQVGSQIGSRMKDGGLVKNEKSLSKKLAKGYKQGGPVDENTTVVPDKGWGKIIIIDSKNDDKNKKDQYNPKKSPIEQLEEGGPVSGPGTGTSDSIPAMLSDGEFVIKASEVAKPGILEHLMKINDGQISKKHISQLAKALASKKRG